MKALLALLGLSSLAFVAVNAQTCTAANAHPIDKEVAFLQYLELIAEGWAAICFIGCIKKRHLEDLSKRATLVCTSTEECLSYKNDPFCFNRVTYEFHTADGTTGNFYTGDYTLPDGQQGNLYHGPYPSETGAAISTAASPSTTAPVVATNTPESSAPTTANPGSSLITLTSATISTIPNTVGAVSSAAVTIASAGTSNTVATAIPSSTAKSEAASGVTQARFGYAASFVVSVLGLAVVMY